MSDNDAGKIDDSLRALLPPLALSRLSALGLADGVATIVLDVAGLDRVERDRLEAAVKDALSGASGLSDVRVAMTAERSQGSGSGRKIIAVGSGKGGVGKSTLSANLAVALARLGRKVGLVDADIYGPSQPRLMAIEGVKPQARDSKMIPVQSPHGIGVLSMGNLIEPDQAIAWRGPMASNALGQLIDADWGDVEILVVDLPPGTGDVQLFVLAGVPIIGMVENMAGYVCPHCGEVSDPFGWGGAEECAARLGENFLGRIPLTLAIRQASDAGKPPATGHGPEAQAFLAIARRVATWLDNQ